MPNRSRVLEFIACVEAGNYVEAIERFYTEDGTMQENLGAKRQGREALADHERKALKAVASIETKKVDWFLVDGDRVVINWAFNITNKDGSVRHLNEMACQDWERDLIKTERFYYDPTAGAAQQSA